MDSQISTTHLSVLLVLLCIDSFYISFIDYCNPHYEKVRYCFASRMAPQNSIDFHLGFPDWPRFSHFAPHYLKLAGRFSYDCLEEALSTCTAAMAVATSKASHVVPQYSSMQLALAEHQTKADCCLLWGGVPAVPIYCMQCRPNRRMCATYHTSR